jgi:hypothetical protein
MITKVIRRLDVWEISVLELITHMSLRYILSSSLFIQIRLLGNHYACHKAIEEEIFEDTSNTMSERKRTKRKTMVSKTLYQFVYFLISSLLRFDFCKFSKEYENNIIFYMSSVISILPSSCVTQTSIYLN